MHSQAPMHGGVSFGEGLPKKSCPPLSAVIRSLALVAGTDFGISNARQKLQFCLSCGSSVHIHEPTPHSTSEWENWKLAWKRRRQPRLCQFEAVLRLVEAQVELPRRRHKSTTRRARTACGYFVSTALTGRLTLSPQSSVANTDVKAGTSPNDPE